MASLALPSKVYVTNLESNNQQRFEGANSFAGAVINPADSVRGRIAFSRITVLDHAGTVTPRHLNKHIDYDTCCASLPNPENAKSVAFPMSMAITQNGQTLYVAALGSSKVAVYNTTALENDTFIPDTANQIRLSGGGPTGVLLDERKARLYVLTRFDNAIKIINTQTQTELDGVAMYNPEPAHVVSGRRFLYDAAFSSSHGDSACASCHIFGDMDHLGWNLGNPDQPNVPDPNVYVNTPSTRVFASMKGVMTTQSLRGMDNQGPMHWRSDRTGAAVEPSAPPNAGHFNERLAFKAFNVAFPGLLGRDSPIPDANMEAFTRFILKVMYPPNPDPNEPLTSFPPFLGIQINNPEGLSMLPAGFPIHEALDAYMMVFDSNFAPIVGQQVTLTDDNEAEARPRITLLRARALQDECQLIARDADNEGYLFGGSVYVRNQANKPPLTEAQLRTKAHPHGAVRARLSLPDSDVPRCAREGTPCSRPQDCTIEECDALEH